MAKNNPPGDGHRVGAVKQRSQTLTPSGHYVKRDTDTGRFLDVKTTDKTPFKGVRREKSRPAMLKSTNRPGATSQGAPQHSKNRLVEAKP